MSELLHNVLDPALILLSSTTSRMEIWRYRGLDSCDLVYKTQLPNPLSTPFYTRGNFLLENYGGCLIMLTPDKVAIYIVDWLKSEEVCFEAQIPVSIPFSWTWLISLITPSRRPEMYQPYSMRMNSSWRMNGAIVRLFRDGHCKALSSI
jgi:hypothetical protein